MEIRGSTLILIAAAAGAAIYAAYNAGQSSSPASSVSVAAPPPRSDMIDPNVDMGQQELPPNHPPIDQGAMNGMNGASGASGASGMATADDEPAAIQWKAPAGWQVAANPNAMRIATYKVPAAKGDAEGAEVIVARAGGGVDANIQRWVGQFGADAKDARTKEKVAGFDVTFVEVSGAYSGGMSMNDPAPKAQAGWSLRGAIVDTPGSAYFFKMIGPTATVTSARAAFDAMIHGISKT